MIKKVIFLILTIFLLQSASFVYSQGPIIPPSVTSAPKDDFTLPTVGPAQGGTGAGQNAGTANCDVCGYCAGAAAPSNWSSCGRCMYPSLVSQTTTPESGLTLKGLPEPDQDHYYTDLGCISTDPGEFAAQISRLFFSIVGGIAFLYFLYGSAVVATARSDPERLNHGKRIVYGSIIGLLFVLFSLFLVRFLAGSLGLPGIG